MNELPFAMDEELDAFQLRHGVTLPSDFRTYLKGKASGSTFVRNLVSLHNLSQLEIKKAANGTIWCVFADYSIWIYGLAISISNPESSAVYIMHPPVGHRIADSIDEFLTLLFDPVDTDTETFWASAMILSEDQIRSFKESQAKKRSR